MKRALKLGCIGDDFTGSTDLANNLARSGMRVVQTIGTPAGALPEDAGVDAVVVALKSRTIAVSEAIEQSLQAAHWLREQGAEQIYFKVCSTFDSTAQGNIGPVTEALMAALGADFCLVTPAFPETGRTVFKGHLFVGDVLLNESGMQNHPLTPMTDPNLVRVMQAQCRTKVGLIDYRTVSQGTPAIEAAVKKLKSEGVSIALVDATSNADLMVLGAACRSEKLMTAGSGLAIGLPQNHGLVPHPSASVLPAAKGEKAIVSGSCSLATNGQVAYFKQQGGAAFNVDIAALVSNADLVVKEALGWARAQWQQKPGQPVLIYSSAAAAEVKKLQQVYGAQNLGEAIEQCLATIARELVNAGAGRLIFAGGETSGACVKALGIEQLQIGAQICPGVPWCYTKAAGGHTVHVALKSGNFGAPDFFFGAFAELPGAA